MFRGGGNTLNGLPTLSNISLRWMLREAQPLGLLIDSIALFKSPVYNYSYPEIRRLIPPQFINFRFESEKKRAFEEWNVNNPSNGPTKVDMSAVDVSDIVRLAAELDARPLVPPTESCRTDRVPLTSRVEELGEDLAEARHESLTGLYKLLEWMPLQRWIYVESGGDSRTDTRKLKRVLVTLAFATEKCVSADMLHPIGLTGADQGRCCTLSASIVQSCTSSLMSVSLIKWPTRSERMESACSRHQRRLRRTGSRGMIC